MDAQQLAELISTKDKEIAELNTRIKELEAKLQEADSKKEEAEKEVEKTASEFAAYRDDAVNKARVARVEALISAGKLIPAERENTINMAKALGIAGSTVNFSASDGQITAEEQYFRGLEAQGVSAMFSAFKEPEHNAKYQRTAIDTSKL